MKFRSTFKKLLAMLLAIAMLLTTAACAKDQHDLSLENCAAMLLAAIPEPAYGSVGGEWVAFGLARWEGEVPQEWFDHYYIQVEAYVKSSDGVLHEKKYTEYSRVILALTAIGKDPANVGGYNLLEPLSDYEQTVFQGINGPIFALLALDSGNYEIPGNTSGSTQATRELYVNCILDQELPSGGWSLAGGRAEIDITAMALQALAKYRERQDVASAVERALTVLSDLQNENGGYTVYNAESSESISQVIVALAELGIGTDDARFVKNGKSLKDRLLDFAAEDGGFRHILDGDTDLMATEQAFYALVALERLNEGAHSLYDMTDAA